MTDRVKNMLDLLNNGEYKSMRRKTPEFTFINETELASRTRAFRETLENETPLIFEDDIFGFNRTLKTTCGYIWEAGNITPDYSIISKGFKSLLKDIEIYSKNADTKKKEYYNTLKEHINIIFEFCTRYRKEAERKGNTLLANALKHIPEYGAESLYEACLFQKIIIFTLRAAAQQHITLGRFDIYMLPFYLSDIEHGKTKEELLEIIELYFISLNIDTDLYTGVQQGDNGQSMVLGGFDKNGKDMFNEVSELCMDASLELCLIDPKINLRVGKTTPLSRYEYGTSLTKMGLGFPQYSNDDIVVPGLVALGYDYEDAINYTVAACWEFIVPGCAYDIPNLATFNFPLVINNAIHKYLTVSDSFEVLMNYVKSEINAEAKNILNISHTGNYNHLSPMLSLLVEGTIEKGIDIIEGSAKYNNNGCHGAGIANASDALAAVKQLVFTEKSLDKETLITALNNDFKGYDEIREKMIGCPKMGNNDDFVDKIAIELMNYFSNALNNKPNKRGGIWRAGTGSAMEYIFSARVCPATADGRNAFTPYSSSFSPSINVKLNGPLSVIKSFTKYDLKKIINGGPLTLEIHDTVFRNSEGEKKVSQLVKLFIDNGGHQLQLNAVNRERLIDAQKNPEKYQNLIVRVWGWSGYFCRLDKIYQDHIIARTEFAI